MAAPKARIATITGTFLAPGVSSNGRLYTTENIGKAVARMQASIAGGAALPLTMETGHPEKGQSEDVRRIVGRLVEVSQRDDGSAYFRADVPDTTAGRDLVALTAAPTPYLSSVSIRGAWVGDVRQVEHDGRPVETADDLNVRHVDWTSRPGVAGARIDAVQLAESITLEDLPLRESTETQLAVLAEEGVLPDDAHLVEDAPATEASMEDTLTAVRNALYDQYDKADWIDLIATTDADATYQVHGGKKDGTWRATYAIGGDGKVTFGDPEEVNVTFTTTVSPKESEGEAPVTETMVPVDPDGDGDVDALYCDQCGCVIPVAALDPDGDGAAAAQATGDLYMSAAANPESSKTEAKPVEESAAPASTSSTPTEKPRVLHLTEADVARIATEAATKAARKAVKENRKAERKSANESGTKEPVAEKAPAASETSESATGLAALKEAVRAEVVADVVKTLRESGVSLRKGVVPVIKEGEKAFAEMSESEQRAYETQLWNAVIHPETSPAS